MGGLSLVWLGIRQAVVHGDKVGVLLLGWLAVAFIFPTFLNWGVSARSLVALVPIVGLIVARIYPDIVRFSRGKVIVCLLPMMLCSLLVASADFEMASRYRQIAIDLAPNRTDLKNRTVWFEGHWGFQYYMQKFGAKALDIANSKVERDDILVLPMNNADLVLPKPGRLQLYKKLTVSNSLPITVMNKLAGAGYHSYYWGGLPFVFGLASHEDFYILIFPSARRGLGA